MMRCDSRLSGPLWLFAGALMLASCSSTAPKPPVTAYQVKDGTEQNRNGGYKVGKPYQIQGVWYYPSEDYSYDETGVASWYGPDFHGKFTANGEVFDQNDVTAAHRTLPMPSIIRVTNLENGKSIVVRVNDRGPFAHGRILDLSKHASELLGMNLQGTARVRVQILADESRALAMNAKNGEQPPPDAAPRVAVEVETLAPPPGRAAAPAKTKPGKSTAPAPATTASPAAELASVDEQTLDNQTPQQGQPRATQLYIQAGAFSRYDYANRMNVALAAVGPSSISQIQTKAGSFFRVRVGPLASVADADAMLEKIIASGYPDARLVAD